MALKHFTVLNLLDLDLREHDSLSIRCVGGRKGLSRKITRTDLNRPGLALSGFFDSFAYERIQLFGRGEAAYLQSLNQKGVLQESLHSFFGYAIPVCVFTQNLSPDPIFINIAEQAECPVLITDLSSTEFTSRILRVLTNLFAPSMSIHGVFLEVYGLGVLILGDSGVGKSETALELIERGHRLVADDLVEIRCLNGNSIRGRGANKAIGHHMEIRGLGIINIAKLYGVGAIREEKEVQFIVKLEEWNSEKVYDRIGTDQLKMDMLGVTVPMIELPVKPGRNIPIIIETAAMNERLKNMGYYSAKEFNKNVLRWIESDTARSSYYVDD